MNIKVAIIAIVAIIILKFSLHKSYMRPTVTMFTYLTVSVYEKYAHLKLTWQDTR